MKTIELYVERVCEIEALRCEREGMVAENMQRKYQGDAMAYVEDSFLVLANRFRALAKEQKEAL